MGGACPPAPVLSWLPQPYGKMVNTAWRHHLRSARLAAAWTLPAGGPAPPPTRARRAPSCGATPWRAASPQR